MYQEKKILLPVLLIAIVLLKNRFMGHKIPHDACNELIAAIPVNQVSQQSQQIIVVKSMHTFQGSISLCEFQQNQWKQVTPTFTGVIGKAGLVAAGEKREGDLKTPAGFYSLGGAFGTKPLAVKMDYKFITVDDKFIDDPQHKEYNTWINGPTTAKSFEPMLIKPYSMGLVVNYNMNPIIRGAGSAIFIHLWHSSQIGTSGCVAMSEKHLTQIIHWLNKQKHPFIYLTK
ncbi:MAG: L,D-transpeptidase family protein [bacterium]|nr:L,D-transpeptidase family protein [bacterium]